MIVGIVGAPNKGKSTIFSALTTIDVEIAAYPFTTIDPNLGVAYVSRRCVDAGLGVKCKPRNSLCKDGNRMIPVNIIDVAGLVPGAHLGKGMGNRFLNDLSEADALILVVDISGRTDSSGNVSEYSDPLCDLTSVKKELDLWLSGIIKKHMKNLSKMRDGEAALLKLLSGLKINRDAIRKAAETNSLSLSRIEWGDEEIDRFSSDLMQNTKPILVAANKLDIGTQDALMDLERKANGIKIIGCSGSVELALRKAAAKNIIRYIPGASSFEIEKEVVGEMRDALEYISRYLKYHGSTGVNEILSYAVFSLLDMIVVYPVEDENKYADHFGNVLPDAILIKKGSTAQDLAYKIHTDLGERMLYAIDARKKMKISKEYVLCDNDIIKIVSSAKHQ